MFWNLFYNLFMGKALKNVYMYVKLSLFLGTPSCIKFLIDFSVYQPIFLSFHPSLSSVRICAWSAYSIHKATWPYKNVLHASWAGEVNIGAFFSPPMFVCIVNMLCVWEGLSVERPVHTYISECESYQAVVFKNRQLSEWSGTIFWYFLNQVVNLVLPL